jgi:hypothetical protein
MMKRKNNKLNRAQYRQLEDWMVAHKEELEAGKLGARHEIAAVAQRDLKFMIMDSNVTTAGDTMGIVWPSRGVMSGNSPRTKRRWKVITDELHAVMKALGHQPSAEFLALVAEAESCRAHNN